MQVRIKIALALFAALATATAAQAATYGPGAPTRAQYVARAEKVCQKSTLKMNKDFKTSNAALKKGNTKKGGGLIVTAAGTFHKTVGKLAKLTRPPADATLLGRWVKSLRVDVKLLGNTGKTIVKTGASSQARKALKRMGAHGVKTNAIVNGFGFHFCLLGVTK